MGRIAVAGTPSLTAEGGNGCHALQTPVSLVAAITLTSMVSGRKAVARISSAGGYPADRVGRSWPVAGHPGAAPGRKATLDFYGVEAAVAHGDLSRFVAVLLCLLVFMGSMVKSARFPLHVWWLPEPHVRPPSWRGLPLHVWWLPDAGGSHPHPDPCRCHAAAMVVAGGFLVARLELLYSLFPEVQLVIACIAASPASWGHPLPSPGWTSRRAWPAAPSPGRVT